MDRFSNNAPCRSTFTCKTVQFFRACGELFVIKTLVTFFVSMAGQCYFAFQKHYRFPIFSIWKSIRNILTKPDYVLTTSRILLVVSHRFPDPPNRQNFTIFCWFFVFFRENKLFLQFLLFYYFNMFLQKHKTGFRNDTCTQNKKYLQ